MRGALGSLRMGSRIKPDWIESNQAGSRQQTEPPATGQTAAPAATGCGGLPWRTSRGQPTDPHPPYQSILHPHPQIDLEAGGGAVEHVPEFNSAIVFRVPRYHQVCCACQWLDTQTRTYNFTHINYTQKKNRKHAPMHPTLSSQSGGCFGCLATGRVPRYHQVCCALGSTRGLRGVCACFGA